jgi:hypothetical protein
LYESVITVWISEGYQFNGFRKVKECCLALSGRR